MSSRRLTYDGACTVCLQGTDTALGFRGEAEWAIAGLVVLGVPEEQAEAIVSARLAVPRGYASTGTVTIVVRVCAACVDAAKPSFPRPGLYLPDLVDVPVIVPQNDEDRREQ